MNTRRDGLTLAIVGMLVFGPGSSLVAQGTRVSGLATAPDSNVSGIVVYLVPSGALAPVPPARAQIDQRNLAFVPRVVAVSPGSLVGFRNSDAVMHNVFHPGKRMGGFDLGTYPEREARSFVFADEGAYLILCHVHPEMAAYVVVVASPYRTVTDDDGSFRIDGVAPGTYRVRTWHRRLKSHDKLVTVGAEGARLQLELTVGKPSEPGVAPRAGRR
jgi:plastocyanin